MSFDKLATLNNTSKAVFFKNFVHKRSFFLFCIFGYIQNLSLYSMGTESNFIGCHRWWGWGGGPRPLGEPPSLSDQRGSSKQRLHCCVPVWTPLNTFWRWPLSGSASFSRSFCRLTWLSGLVLASSLGCSQWRRHLLVPSFCGRIHLTPDDPWTWPFWGWADSGFLIFWKVPANMEHPLEHGSLLGFSSRKKQSEACIWGKEINVFFHGEKNGCLPE